MKNLIIILISVGYFFTTIAEAITLVSKKSIDNQKSATKVFELSNGIPVIYRYLENSAVNSLTLNYPYGPSDLPLSERAYVSQMTNLMPRGTIDFSKDQIFILAEKLSAGIQCSSILESTSCTMGAVAEAWDEFFPVFVSITQQPIFDKTELQLAVRSHIATLESQIESPNTYVNEIVNKSFYADSHPYSLSTIEEIGQLKRINTAHLKAIHDKIKVLSGQFFTYVGGQPLTKIKSDLEKSFGKIQLVKSERAAIKSPIFNEKSAVSYEPRDLPTSFIRIKFNLPGRNHEDYIKAVLMMDILSEQLNQEIRTNRSLSYSIQSFLIGNRIGIGVISVSTPDPKATLDAITSVINTLKSKKLTIKELDSYKNVYTTTYYLALEGHAELASALSTSYFYHESVDPFYDRPDQLADVDDDDIQKLAQAYLCNFRIGIIYKENGIAPSILENFVKIHKNEASL